MIKGDPKHFIHVLAILATEIQDFPECIEYVKEETAAGTMFPEVHGLHHIDYAKLPYHEAVSQLSEARAFIIQNFNYVPTIWYSPWGAGADKRGEHLRAAAIDAGLNLVTCQDMIQPGKLVTEIRATTDPMGLIREWEGKEILRHWWEGSGALMESIRFFKEHDP
jgi:peptidoglycan/xylan/chitin deacetylase (PgdA/CDA1 family)